MPEVVIYSSHVCPYCVHAKRLLDSKAIQYQEVVVDGKPDLRQQMIELSGRHTVPQIWIGDQHIGGCDDLFDLERCGELNAMLTAEIVDIAN